MFWDMEECRDYRYFGGRGVSGGEKGYRERCVLGHGDILGGGGGRFLGGGGRGE